MPKESIGWRVSSSFLFLMAYYNRFVAFVLVFVASGPVAAGLFRYNPLMLKVLLSVFIIAFSFLGYASPWVTNKDHSEVLFQIPYMGVSELTGRFNEFTGEVKFKDRSATIERLNVRISAASIDTGNKMRDGHLKGSDFFQSQQHPSITFQSSKISRLVKNSYRAQGVLSIKGIEKNHTIDFSMTESLKDTWGYENKFVKFKSTVNRNDFKITWNKTLDGKQFLVGDTITFWGTFQVQPASGTTPNSKHMIPDTDYIRQRDLKKRTEEESTFSRSLRKLINGK